MDVDEAGPTDTESSIAAVEEAVRDAGAFLPSSPASLKEDPPLGEGWDENGNDLSKAANDAVRKMHCEAWIAKLKQEAAAIRAGDHPVVMRRSKLTMSSSNRRAKMTERSAKRQREIAQTLHEEDVERIKGLYDTAVEQTRERLLTEANEEIRRSKNLMEGFKEDMNRMNTRHTRGNAKGSIEDPWLTSSTGSKANGNGKRPMCAVTLVLEDDDLSEDIEFLRYSDRDNNSNSRENNTGSGSNNNNRDNGESGGGGGGGAGGSDYTYAENGRARRAPGWRRDE
ncbi:unnamed protein product [Scytosiphon promiscuus]